MTVRKFLKIYSHYKNNFDLELQMQAKGITYARYAEKQIEDEEWL